MNSYMYLLICWILALLITVQSSSSASGNSRGNSRKLTPIPTTTTTVASTIDDENYDEDYSSSTDGATGDSVFPEIDEEESFNETDTLLGHFENVTVSGPFSNETTSRLKTATNSSTNLLTNSSMTTPVIPEVVSAVSQPPITTASSVLPQTGFTDTLMLDETTTDIKQKISGITPIALRHNDQIEGSGAHGLSGTTTDLMDPDNEDEDDVVEPVVEGSGMRPMVSGGATRPGASNSDGRSRHREGSGTAGPADDIGITGDPWAPAESGRGKQVTTAAPSAAATDLVITTPDSYNVADKDANTIVPESGTDDPDEEDLLAGLPHETIVQKQPNSSTSLLAQPAMLAAVIGGAVVGLLCAILLVMYLLYRMRKKDEGSYALEEPTKRPGGYMRAPTNSSKEYYA